MTYVPKKSFGQNFLQDDALLDRIAFEICSLRETPQTRVYEIGAGLGALTKALLKQHAIVSAIERDRDLIPILHQTFSHEISSGQLELHEANATTFFLHPSPPKTSPLTPLHPVERGKFVLCGNLPYHLTATLFFETARLYKHIFGAVYLIQKEVADRIAAQPHSRTYGLLSVLLQSRFDVSIIENVSKDSFWPAPKVESSVIRLKTKTQTSDVDWDLFVKIVKTAFSKRRKMLTNSLSDPTLNPSPETGEGLKNLLINLNINPKSRAEDLSFEDYERLARTIKTQP